MEFQCCVCLDKVEQEYKLIGFGCCTAKVCLTCKSKLKSCPQCRTDIKDEVKDVIKWLPARCRICSFDCQPAPMISQICRRIYDSLLNQTYTMRRKYFSGTKNYCPLHFQLILKRLESYGCLIDICTNNLIQVTIGYELCNICNTEKVKHDGCSCSNTEIEEQYSFTEELDNYVSPWENGHSYYRIYERIFDYNKDDDEDPIDTSVTRVIDF
jgi:hypothetical protein